MYYSSKNKKFIFCSEIKGINDENNRYKQNDSSIINFIKWGGLDHSNQTWFKDIRSIKPGTLIIIDKNLSILEKKYYSFDENVNKKKINPKDITLQFKNLLEKSVKQQSETVRSIGANLSGGVDSSIVTLFLKKNRGNINTYTFGYNEKK